VSLNHIETEHLIDEVADRFRSLIPDEEREKISRLGEQGYFKDALEIIIDYLPEGSMLY